MKENERSNRSMPRISYRLHIVLGVSLLLAVGFVDYITGPEVTAFVFYLIPVVYLGWFCGEREGVVATFSGLFIWVFSDYEITLNKAHPFIPYWNGVARGIAYLFAALICVRLQSSLKLQKVMNAQLASNNEEITRLADVKSEFASIISHELRSPITAIKENVAILYDGSVGALTDEQREFLGSVKRNVDHLTRLVNDILDFQRFESGHMRFNFQAQDLNKLVSEVVSNYAILAENKGLELKSDLAPNLPLIKVDYNRISQALVNLIQNAIRYSDRGHIIVKTDYRENYVTLSVEDQGVGISPEDFPKLFKTFQRLSNHRVNDAEGTGLGLMITKRIVEAHHGVIKVNSELGRGSVFKIIFHVVP